MLDIIKRELDLIKLTFNQNKTLTPIIIFLVGKNRYVVPFNPANKEIVNIGIRDLVKQVTPDIVMFALETWITQLEIDQVMTRQHVVQVQIECKTGEKLALSARIMKIGELIILGAFRTLDKDNMADPFTDIFEPKRLRAQIFRTLG